MWGAHRIDVVPDSCCKNYKYQCGINFEISDINRQVSSISSDYVCSEIHRTTTICVLKRPVLGLKNERMSFISIPSS